MVWKSGNSTRKRPWLRFVCPQAWGKGYLSPVTRTENKSIERQTFQFRTPQVKAYSLVGGRYVNIVVFTSPKKFHSSRTWKIMGKGATTWTTWLVRKFSWANGETLPGSKSENPRCHPLITKIQGKGIFSPKKADKKTVTIHTWLSWLAEVRVWTLVWQSHHTSPWCCFFFVVMKRFSPQTFGGFDIRCPNWLQLVHLDE